MAAVLAVIAVFAAGYAELGVWAVVACAPAYAIASATAPEALYGLDRPQQFRQSVSDPGQRNLVSGLIVSSGAYAAGLLMQIL